MALQEEENVQRKWLDFVISGIQDVSLHTSTPHGLRLNELEEDKILLVFHKAGEVWEQVGLEDVYKTRHFVQYISEKVWHTM